MVQQKPDESQMWGRLRKVLGKLFFATSRMAKGSASGKLHRRRVWSMQYHVGWRILSAGLVQGRMGGEDGEIVEGQAKEAFKHQARDW